MNANGIDADAVRQRAESLRGEMTDFLAQLAAVESPSTDPGSQEPVLNRLAERLEELGYLAKILPGVATGGILYARPRRRPRSTPIQLLIGHCDTVWPVGTIGSMPVRVEEGRIRGPGVYDMKGGLTQMVFALKIVHEMTGMPPAIPVVVVNSDEEIGSRESTTLIRRLARVADRTYVLEPSLGRDGKLKTARKGVGRFTVEIGGIAAHAGLQPGSGASAILELAHVVQQLHALNDPERGVSVNVGQIEGGLRANVVAPTSRAVVDVRVPTHEDAERVEAFILALAPTVPGTTLKVSGRFGRPPMERTPRNRKLWLAAQVAGVALGLDLEEATAGGGSDGNTTSLYSATLDGLGATGDGAHAAHEYADLDRMTERTALLALLLSLEPLHGSSQ